MIKDKKTAKQVSRLLLHCCSNLDQSVSLVMESCDKQEFQEYRKIIGDVMGVLFLDILDPVYKLHPDLKPDELD
jgi:hypothetical protein